MSFMTRYRTGVLTGRFVMEADNPVEISVYDTMLRNRLHERYLELDGDKDYFITNVFKIYKEMRAIKKNVRFIPAYAYPKPKTKEKLITDKVMIHKPTSELVDAQTVDIIKKEYGMSLGYNPLCSPPSCSAIKIEDRYEQAGVVIDTSSNFYQHLFIRTQDDFTQNINGWQTIFWPSFTINDGQTYNIVALEKDRYVVSFIYFMSWMFYGSKLRVFDNLVSLCFTFSLEDYAHKQITLNKFFDNYTIDYFEECNTEEDAADVFFNTIARDLYH